MQSETHILIIFKDKNHSKICGQETISDKDIFEEKHLGCGKISIPVIRGSFLGKRLWMTKTPRQEYAWHVQQIQRD